MRRKVIFIQYLTLLFLGVLMGWVGYYSLQPILDQEYTSWIDPLIEWLKQWEQGSNTVKFLSLELKSEWLLFAIPVILGVLLATILAAMILLFVKEKSVPVTKIRKASKAISKTDEKEEKANDAIELLTCLQREGRLIDFLQEDISSYDDAQVGAAVRNIHENTKKALAKMVSLEPIAAVSEGDSIQIEAGFDPSAIRLTGSIKDTPPYSGTVNHRGWKVTRLAIENRPQTHDINIIEPLEVEVS